jgi:hypothetical protein
MALAHRTCMKLPLEPLLIPSRRFERRSYAARFKIIAKAFTRAVVPLSSVVKRFSETPAQQGGRGFRKLTAEDRLPLLTG